MKEGTIEALRSIWNEVIEKRKLASGFVPFKRKDGKIVIHYGVEIPYGKGRGRLWAAIDITKLKDQEKQLAEAKAYLRGIIDHMADGLCVVDNDGIWLMVNPAMEEITGYSKKELLREKTLEHPFEQLPETKEAVGKLLERLKLEGSVKNIEVPWLTKGGKKIIVSASEKQLIGANDQVLGSVLIVRDITELKEASIQIAKVIEDLAQADLTKKIDLRFLTGDLRKMAQDVNKLIDIFNPLIGQIKQWVKDIASTAQSLGASAEELNASTEQISSAVNQIAQGATSQTQKIEDIKKATLNLIQISEDYSLEAESAAGAAAETAKIAISGSEAAKETMAKTAQIIEATNDLSLTVQNLGGMIDEIEIMVDFITTISEQTNLLALNASVEAARAGEQGRAFGVVAEEVKKLADNSKESAAKIANTVKNIQIERTKAIRSMEASLKEIKEGQDIINNSLSALNEIAKLVQETAKMSQKILSATKREKETIENITKAIEEISAVAEENAASTQESAASTQEQTSSMEELTAVAQELAQMTKDLDKNIARFKITE
jgi:PAS domain S-box-containing protein